VNVADPPAEPNANQASDALDRLIKAWRQGGSAVNLGYRLTPKPYPGLKSFAPAQASVFFGREGQEENLAARLEQHNFLGVLGGSGSGKSSLVRAGLLPYLRSVGKISDRGGRWYVVEMRPGKDPTSAMIGALWTQVCAPMSKQKLGRQALNAAFGDPAPELDGTPNALETAGRLKLAEMLKGANRALKVRGLFEFANTTLQIMDETVSGGIRSGPANLLLLIDQFEEIFRTEIDTADRQAVIDLVKAVNREERQGLFLTLTMRSEELHRCAEHPGLSEIVLDTSVQIELISEDKDVEAAIIEPARRVFRSWGVPYAEEGLYARTAPFAPRLVQALIFNAKRLRESLDHKPDSLPLLQHALQSIWDAALTRWEAERDAGKPVSMATLEREDFPFLTHESPLRKCLDVEADNAREGAMKTLLHEQDWLSEKSAGDLVDVAFISLARLDDNNRWVRHFSSPGEIAAASGLNLPFARKTELVELALQEFHGTGYVWFRNGQYDVTHEALIRSWKHYQTILGDTQAVTKSLTDLDEILAEKEKQAVSPPSEAPAPSLAHVLRSIVAAAATPKTYVNGFRRFGAWLEDVIRLGLLQPWRDAWGHLQRGRKEALERIFAAPSQFSTAWAKDRLGDEWRQKAKLTAAAPATSAEERVEETTRDEQKIAEKRMRQFRDLLVSAERWRKWWWVPGAAIGTLLICVGGYLALSLQTTSRLHDVISVQTLINDRAPGRLEDQKYADFDLHQGVSRAASWNENVVQQAWGPTKIQPAFDKLFYQLDLTTREALKPLHAYVGAKLFGDLRENAGENLTVTWGKIECLTPERSVGRDSGDKKSEPPRIARDIPDIGVRGIALLPEGIKVWYRTSKDGEERAASERPLSFIFSRGLVCLDETATMLLVWNPFQLPFLVHFTWVQADPPSNVTPDLTRPDWTVITDPLYIPQTSEYSRSIIDASVDMWRGTDFGKRITKFQIGQPVFEKEVPLTGTEIFARGFQIELKDLKAGLPESMRQNLYISYAVGVNQPEAVPEIVGPGRSGEICARAEPICRIENLELGGDRKFVLERRIVDHPQASTGPRQPAECSTPRSACLQQLRLYAADQSSGQPVLRFRKLDHYSAKIVHAAVEGDDLFLWDWAGQKWRYSIGWLKLRKVIQANDLTGNLIEFARNQAKFRHYKGFATPDARRRYLSEVCRQASCDTWRAQENTWSSAVSRGVNSLLVRANSLLGRVNSFLRRWFTTPPAAAPQVTLLPAR
jgi:hypothetical protein